MAGKATAQDIVDEGFREELFGAPAGFFDTWLPRLLLDAELWARLQIGDAAYDSAVVNAGTTPMRAAWSKLVQAEVYITVARLWERRVVTVEGNAVQGLEDPGANRAAYLAHADTYRSRAWAEMREAGDHLGVAVPDAYEGSAIAVGHVETGRFPAASSTAVTA
ncbi:MAG: hypothetical protein ACK51F_10720 [Rhodospirillales bacterium]|jgi:hypothetical protein